MRAGITRDTVSPVETLQIEKDGNGDPTGVFSEREMHRLRNWSGSGRRRGSPMPTGLRLCRNWPSAYHAFGTTSVFEGHGIANEVLRAYKEAHQTAR